MWNPTFLKWTATLLMLSLSAGPGRAAELTGTGPERMKKDLTYLASDELEGRGVGTNGLNKAADYIRQSLAESGWKLDAVNGEPFQPFTMTTGAEQGETNTLRFAGPDGKEITFEKDKDFTVCSFGGSGKLDGEIVFGGYAIDAKKIPYRDFEGVDLKGKIVIVIRKNPQQDNPKSSFGGHGGVSQYGDLRTKLSQCTTAGAAAVLFVNDPHTVGSEAEKAIDAATNAVIKAARAVDQTEPSADGFPEARKTLSDALKKLSEATGIAHGGGIDTLMKFGYAGYGKEGAIPALHITVAKANELLQATLKKSLADLEAEINADLKPRTAVLPGWKAQVETTVKLTRTEVKNIIASLDGEGPLADETIVVGAHYDHVGRGGPGSLAPGSNEIHNGADDNGSGTVALLELARRLKARPQKLPRRVVIIAFTAEESGLIGSAKYVEQPVWPLEKTIAMFNMDMVGRLTEKLTVFGADTAPNFRSEVTELGTKFDLKLNLKPEGFGPSDHSSFYGKKIPVLHFFTGTHSDYHRPGDDTEKINFDGMNRIVGMMEEMVVQTALRDERPKYVEVAGQADVGARSGSRPYFGSIPDFGSEGKGYAISGVSPGSPAAKGGLKSGDLIVQLGEKKVTDLNDFDLALRDFSAGDEITVVVQRGGQDVKLKVTLAAPR